jgi:hypothetical protein
MTRTDAGLGGLFSSEETGERRSISRAIGSLLAEIELGSDKAPFLATAGFTPRLKGLNFFLLF